MSRLAVVQLSSRRFSCSVCRLAQVQREKSLLLDDDDLLLAYVRKAESDNKDVSRIRISAKLLLEGLQ